MEQKQNAVTECLKRVGRSYNYEVSYCALVIDWMAGGRSLESFCAHIEVPISKVYQWCTQYPAFKDSVEIGMAKCQNWWETLLLMHATGQHKDKRHKINGKTYEHSSESTIKFMLTKRFRAYVDRVVNEELPGNSNISKVTEYTAEISEGVIITRKEEKVIEVETLGGFEDSEILEGESIHGPGSNVHGDEEGSDSSNDTQKRRRGRPRKTVSAE
jgi:hypothetical protein